MTQPSPDLARRKGYHHGSLDEALIEAARRLVAERGAMAFTLADATRLAGVTPAAVYRHFADRNALLAAVARRGFGAFGRALESAVTAETDPKAGFLRMGDAYLDFARTEPGYYGAMFGSGLKTPDFGSEGDTAFGVLVRAIIAAASVPEEEALGLAMQVWALAHGIAMLEASGVFGGPDCPVAPEVALREGSLAMIGTKAD